MQYAVFVYGLWLGAVIQDLFLFLFKTKTVSEAKTFRGHYPLYAPQNSVLMVDTWMCSALPQELEIIGDPIVVRSNALLI